MLCLIPNSDNAPRLIWASILHTRSNIMANIPSGLVSVADISSDTRPLHLLLHRLFFHVFVLLLLVVAVCLTDPTVEKSLVVRCEVAVRMRQPSFRVRGRLGPSCWAPWNMKTQESIHQRWANNRTDNSDQFLSNMRNVGPITRPTEPKDRHAPIRHRTDLFYSIFIFPVLKYVNY